MQPATKNDLKALRKDFDRLETKVDKYQEVNRKAYEQILAYLKDISEQLISHTRRLDQHDAEIGLLKTAWLHEHGR
jgi:hypothetical protein